MRLKHFIVIAVIVILPLLFSFTSPRFAESLRIFSFSLLKPILQVTQFVSLAAEKSYTAVRDYHRVYRENSQLKRELEEARKNLIRFAEIEKENERFREMLEFRKELGVKQVAARVIARDISYWSRWIVLDKGEDDGVLPGMILINHKGLLGRVISTGRHVARGILILDGESRVSVLDQPTRDLGLLEGRGDELPVIRLIALDAGVKPGDAVITSGLGGTYPKGIPVGVIASVSKDRDGLHKNAVLKPYADLKRMEEVFCLSITVPS